MQRTKHSILPCLQQTPPKRYSDALLDCWGLSWRFTAKWRGQPASTPGQRWRQMDISHPTCRWVQLCDYTRAAQRGGSVSFPSRLLWDLWVVKLNWDSPLPPPSRGLWVLRFSPCPYDCARALYFFRILLTLGTAVAQWLRSCATNRRVVGSIQDGVFGIFHWPWGRLSL